MAAFTTLQYTVKVDGRVIKGGIDRDYAYDLFLNWTAQGRHYVQVIESSYDGSSWTDMEIKGESLRRPTAEEIAAEDAEDAATLARIEAERAAEFPVHNEFKSCVRCDALIDSRLIGDVCYACDPLGVACERCSLDNCFCASIPVRERRDALRARLASDEEAPVDFETMAHEGQRAFIDRVNKELVPLCEIKPSYYSTAAANRQTHRKCKTVRGYFYTYWTVGDTGRVVDPSTPGAFKDVSGQYRTRGKCLAAMHERLRDTMAYMIEQERAAQARQEKDAAMEAGVIEAGGVTMCAFCSRDVIKGDNFCGQCGQPLDGDNSRQRGVRAAANHRRGIKRANATAEVLPAALTEVTINGKQVIEIAYIDSSFREYAATWHEANARLEERRAIHREAVALTPGLDPATYSLSCKRCTATLATIEERKQGYCVACKITRDGEMMAACQDCGRHPADCHCDQSAPATADERIIAGQRLLNAAQGPEGILAALDTLETGRYS